ncbi:F-box/WD repeat-containing protein 12 isoform X2 [Protopterus annectens]|nr:F-box/WD repeat-containing protein 12 isoform X2 [Protopterus annectens]XP_043934051.1 F-box/WD repeat-containing protein 12 isoform X2 [Protopterus annectens]
MCLERWTFCNLSKLNPEMQTWKNYYLCRHKLETQMKEGRPNVDYTCKTLRGHNGKIVGVVYVSENEHQFGKGVCNSVVCSASSDGILRAWDVQEGTTIWTSSPQEAPLTSISTVAQYGFLVSTNSQGQIKVWASQSGEELGAFSTSSSSCAVVSYIAKGQPFLSAGTGGGALYTLTVPNLNQLSRITVFDIYKVDLVLSSPDGQWVVAGTSESIDVCPKIYYTDSLINSSQDEPTICDVLPVHGCSSACWLPVEAARIAVVHAVNHTEPKNITVFDIKSKKSKYKMEIMAGKIADFKLPSFSSMNSGILLKGHGADTLLIGIGTELKLYSLSGTLLSTFQDHKDHITALHVDSFRVVTSSMDLSLRIYSWRKQNKQLLLEGRYHLLGGSHMQSRGFTSVVCDYISIVGSVLAKDGKDTLKAYSFTQ